MTGNMHSKARCYSVFMEILFLLLKSGILLCSAEKIVQEPLMVGSDGKEVKLSCNHPSAASSTDNIFWYRKFPNQSPEFVVSGYRGNSMSDKLKDVSLFISGDRKSNSLLFARVTLEDTAVYYCALGAYYGADKLSFGSGTRLTVHPNLEPSLPSVYKLKPSSEEKQGKAACLFTDYSPNPLNVGINKEVTKEVNGSVVVVKEDKSEKGTASYGIVLWGNDTDSFHCHADAENPKGDSGTCLAEDGDITFETDERLNLLSFTVLGLRVIFLKTVSFNLLLTFRLWSR